MRETCSKPILKSDQEINRTGWSSNLLRPMYLHVTFRSRERRKAMLFIQAMGVAGHEHDAPKSLQGRMGQNRLNQPMAESSSLMLFDNIDIAQISKTHGIRDDPSKANLLPRVCVNAETE